MQKIIDVLYNRFPFTWQEINVFAQKRTGERAPRPLEYD
jgi:hypothetical protein